MYATRNLVANSGEHAVLITPGSLVAGGSTTPHHCRTVMTTVPSITERSLLSTTISSNTLYSHDSGKQIIKHFNHRIGSYRGCARHGLAVYKPGVPIPIEHHQALNAQRLTRTPTRSRAFAYHIYPHQGLRLSTLYHHHLAQAHVSSTSIVTRPSHRSHSEILSI
ncbi:hypothetical protein BDV98DRAFT_404636 [Pterulicium gracile]|uniref:Uncharacterized protein n=1 Tax=Pterulicium gracile TaxID=1884261 RepID=A0A5C3QL97_9AGAR|nr:hypothetical protein BDV98DRAFT_404636 [Pterula gracilis]